ncbi:DUF2062 domain-containing protein [Leptospira semungkisensis]|uniref:DUF2062 domain-containing protein n=1 Tax=Leptospira semungkisensis TaxID=2484985 RepID=A0A4R9FXS1_9LEPT|nr:DUF2062 domain-containing protein [Leptospira semungkisensis]TGK03802.1 DUF2062 domain-containing protein [Leptospira semungkisensis]
MIESETENNKTKSSFLGKAKDRILVELKTGTSPEKIALSLALGAAIGVFPIIGSTMALCALLGFLLRLNPVSIQIANYAAYPFQVFLIIPFLKLGSSILKKEIDLGWAYRLAEGDTSQLIDGLSRSAGYAVLGWTSTVPIVAFFSYFLFLLLVRKVNGIIRK